MLNYVIKRLKLCAKKFKFVVKIAILHFCTIEQMSIFVDPQTFHV